jgi:RNA polymerase sigma factor (sigma-70 family)
VGGNEKDKKQHVKGKKSEDPIIESFLADEANYRLAKRALCKPNEKNKKEVDDAFKEFYRRIAIIKYVSKLIYFFSIDYDKKINKQRKTFMLTLDQPLSKDDSSNPMTVKEQMESTYDNNFDRVYGPSLTEQIENEKLLSALQAVTPKQLEILDLIYIHQLSLKEIASKLGTSPQNISNQHRKALRKIKDKLSGG